MKTKTIALLLLLCLGSTSVNFAQQAVSALGPQSQEPPNCINDGPNANCTEVQIGPNRRAAPNQPANLTESGNTSPIEVPEKSDRAFNKNIDSQLDVYTCRPNKITVNIPITRVITKIDRSQDPSGYDAVLQYRYNFPLKMRMPVLDVDPTEVDRVKFNGNYVGDLRGANATWEDNEFSVPMSWVNFATFQGIGVDPIPGENQIEIEVDALNENWCVSIDWIELSFDSLSPVVLIHGNGSNGAFFNRRGFVDGLNEQKILFDNSLNLPYPGNYVQEVRGAEGGKANQTRVQEHLRNVTRGFGVDGVHLVMHSKGGLDTRAYLGNLYYQDKETFKVLSYSTLGTPHNGSILADMSENYERSLTRAGRAPEFEDFPTFTALIASLNHKISGFNIGQANLTTNWVGTFNSTNINRLPRDIDYHTVAADLDRNFNGELDYGGDCEMRGLLNESVNQYWNNPFPECTPAPGAPTLYKILKQKKSINLSYQWRILPTELPGFFIPVRVPVLTALPNSSFNLNDVLVTVQSGHGEGSFYPLVTPDHRKTYEQYNSEGKNHASIADAGTANQVVFWIVTSEAERGDMGKTWPGGIP